MFLEPFRHEFDKFRSFTQVFVEDVSCIVKLLNNINEYLKFLLCLWVYMAFNSHSHLGLFSCSLSKSLLNLMQSVSVSLSFVDESPSWEILNFTLQLKNLLLHIMLVFLELFWSSTKGDFRQGEMVLCTTTKSMW